MTTIRKMLDRLDEVWMVANKARGKIQQNPEKALAEVINAFKLSPNTQGTLSMKDDDLLLLEVTNENAMIKVGTFDGRCFENSYHFIGIITPSTLVFRVG